MKLEFSMSAIKQLMKVEMNVIKMIVNQFILKQKLIIKLGQKTSILKVAFLQLK